MRCDRPRVCRTTEIFVTSKIRHVQGVESHSSICKKRFILAAVFIRTVTLLTDDVKQSDVTTDG